MYATKPPPTTTKNIFILNLGIHLRVLSWALPPWGPYTQTWNLSKILHRRIFRLKILHRQFHLISTVLVRKKTQKMSENGEIYTAGKEFYTAAGSDGSDKFHLCVYYQSNAKYT